MANEQTALAKVIAEFERLKEAATSLRDKLYLDGVIAVIKSELQYEREQMEGCYIYGLRNGGSIKALSVHKKQATAHFNQNYTQDGK